MATIRQRCSNDKELELNKVRDVMDELQAVKKEATAQEERVKELEACHEMASDEMTKAQHAFDILGLKVLRRLFEKHCDDCHIFGMCCSC